MGAGPTVRWVLPSGAGPTVQWMFPSGAGPTVQWVLPTSTPFVLFGPLCLSPHPLEGEGLCNRNMVYKSDRVHGLHG